MIYQAMMSPFDSTAFPRLQSAQVEGGAQLISEGGEGLRCCHD